MYVKYGDKVHFIIIYTIEAHPVGSVCPFNGTPGQPPSYYEESGKPIVLQPETYEERVANAVRAIYDLGITIPMLIDEMDNPIWCTYGPWANGAYLIGTDGIIVERQPWYNQRTFGDYVPELMEEAIIEYLTGPGS